MKKLIALVMILALQGSAFAYEWGSTYDQGDLKLKKNKIQFAERTTPSVPPTDNLFVYSKDNGSGDTKLYTLDHAGTETELGSATWETLGGSQSSINLSGFTNDVPFLTAADLAPYVLKAGDTMTGNLTISKANPKLIVTDTGLSSSAWLEKDTTVDGSRLVSQNRLYSLPNSLTLAGATYSSSLSYTSTGALSVSFWWRTTVSGDSYFIGSSTASSDFRAGSGVLSFQDETAGLARYWTLGAFNDNVWRMITLTISSDRATVKAYINATLATQTQAGTVGGNFVINRIFATNGMTTGSFDDFKIYTKELSQAEVTALYASGSPSEITDMTSVYAYYKLNESSGASASDSSGNGRNLTLTGGSPVWATGKVSAGVNPLSDIPVLKIANNSTVQSYGDLQLGYYSASNGTTNIYEGLTHQFNILGTAKVNINGSGQVLTASGSAALPAIVGSASPTTGIYWTSNNDFLVSTAGVARMSFNNVGTASFQPNGTNTLNVSSTGVGIGGLVSGYSGQFNVQNISSAATTKVTAIIKQQTLQTGDLLLLQNSSASTLINFTYLGGAVFNEQGNDADFRIEGDTNSNLFVVDAGLDHVAFGTTASSSIFARYSKSPTQLATGTTIAQFEGTHTQNADNAIGFVANVSNVGLNSAGFNNTVALNSGGALSGYYGLVQASSTPATGTVTSIQGARMSVRNTGGAIVSDAISFHAMPILNSGAGSVTNAYGFYAGVMAAATNNYGFYSVTTAASGRWNLYMAGSASNYMSGALGIGTSTIDAKVNVVTSGGLVGMKIIGGSEQFRIGYDTSNYASFSIGSTGKMTLTPTGGELFLDVTTGLGVGTTSPAQFVDIVKHQSAGTYTRTYNNSNGTAGIAGFIASAENNQMQFLAHGGGRVATRYGESLADATEFLSLSGASKVLFGAGSQNIPIIFGTNSVEVVRMAGDGNVGIGTNSPAYKLDVNGTINGEVSASIIIQNQVFS